MSFTERFTGRADAYVAGRPSYPDAAIDVLLANLGDPRDVVVADLGAGTGISSRLLAARGVQVLAVEPNAAMRDAAEPCDGVEWVDGTAEATGLHEASVDLAAAFQAFHWFDARKALDEIVRIVRPGGRAAVVYNERDESDEFTGAYGALVRTFATDATERRRADGLSAFAAFEGWHGGPRRTEIRNVQRLDRDGLHSRVRSTSYLPQAGAASESLRADIDALFDRHAREGRIAMVLTTIVVCGDLGADGA